MPTRRSSSGILTERSVNSPVRARPSPRNKKAAVTDTDATSDYGSEQSSRTVTPSTTPSPTPPASEASPAKKEGSMDQIVPEINSEKTEVKEMKIEDGKLLSEVPNANGDSSDCKVDKVPSLSDVSEDEKPLLRAVKEIKEEDGDEDDKTVTSAFFSADDLKEEELAQEQNLARSKEEDKKMEDQHAQISKEQRYEMLCDLLKKSTFFTDYLKNKMKEDIEKEQKKREKQEAKKEREMKEGRSSPKKSDRNVPKSRGRKRPAAEDDTRESKKIRSEGRRFHNDEEISSRQPVLLTGGVMRSYQLDGFEWLAKLYENGINGILADEMGLGKTIQCIALFSFLYENGVSGPFLVVAPLSTVPNWVNEFKRFTPTIPCMLYHGSKEKRAELRAQMGKATHNEVLGRKVFQVVVTSYEIAMNDRAFLSPLGWKFLVVDEGHRLKNMECRLLRELKKYRTDNRLLLTGTPLQNNLRELFSLLNFILPEIFDDVQVFESWFDAKEIQESEDATSEMIIEEEKKNNVINMLHQILLPFLRRRVKADVGLEIPPKKEVIVYCPLTEPQRNMYKAVVERTIEDFLNVKKDEEVDMENQGRGKRKRDSIDYSVFDGNDSKIDERFEANLNKLVKDKQQITPSAYKVDRVLETSETRYSIKSRMMDMRKAVNHPYLIDYPITDDGYYKIDEEVISLCGKMKVLDQMLTQLIKDGHKVLLFSQMTRMLDILGDYLNWRKIKFSRLDGSMDFIARQENIDSFNTDQSVNVFLLSTRAGGLGINLTAADTCIIYDSDWNPQQDLQAQDRCHRIGQTKPVMVYRMVTKGTFDEKIVLRAAAKRKIEKLVIHKDKFNSVTADTEEKAALRIDPQELLDLLHSNDYVGAVTCSDGQVLSKNDLSKLLDRSDLAWGSDRKAGQKSNKSKDVKGVFQVIEDDGERGGLDSVVES